MLVPENSKEACSPQPSADDAILASEDGASAAKGDQTQAVPVDAPIGEGKRNERFLNLISFGFVLNLDFICFSLLFITKELRH